MDAHLLAAAAVGVVAGAVLDPVGQQLAARSRAAEDRRRAERRAAEGPEPGGPGERALELGDEGGTADEPVAHLLPAGRSVPRAVAAAVLTGALFAAAAHRFGPHLVLAPYCVLFAALVAVSATDLTHRLVPRQLLYGALVVVVPLLVALAATTHAWSHLAGAAIAGAAAFAVFFAVWWFVPRGMGFGDVRLAGVIGVSVGFLSLLHAYIAFLVGFVLGALFGVVLMAVSSTGRRTRIPFAPALAAGAVVAVLWGGTLAHDLFHAST